MNAKTKTQVKETQAASLKMLADMLRIRHMEEKCAEVYGAGKIRGFLHLYIGEEACTVGALSALAAENNVLATYREHAHALMRGVPMRAIMTEMYGKAAGCCACRLTWIDGLAQLPHWPEPAAESGYCRVGLRTTRHAQRLAGLPAGETAEGPRRGLSKSDKPL